MSKSPSLLTIMRRRIAAGIREWQELIIWLPVALLLAYIAWRAIPLIDRTAGMDGWGAMWGYLVVAMGVGVAGFLAWLICRTYHLDLDDEAERELIDYAVGIDRDPNGHAFGHGVPSWQGAVIWLGHHAVFLILFWLILGKLLP